MSINFPEAETKEMFLVSLPRACSVSIAWHVTVEIAGTWESLPFPPSRRKFLQPKEEDPMDGKAARLFHSTLRR